MSTLLEYKVDITLVDAHGWTAAKLAEACGHDSLTQLLHVAAARLSHERKAHDNASCAEDSTGPQPPRLAFTRDNNGLKHSAALSARQSRKPFDSLPQARYPSSSTGESLLTPYQNGLILLSSLSVSMTSAKSHFGYWQQERKPRNLR